MEIVVTRFIRGINSTISTCELDGKFIGQFILEDRDRGLRSDMPLEEIKSEKLYGRTAIPTGRYKVLLTFSKRFKRILPILVDVPGFAGIRVHPGNTHQDTEGCLLPGKSYSKKGSELTIGTSRVASADLQFKIACALERKEAVWLEIKRDYK